MLKCFLSLEHFWWRHFYPELGRKNPELGRKIPELGRKIPEAYFWNFPVLLKYSEIAETCSRPTRSENLGSMELNSQLSKSLSSSTLIRGAGLLRSSTMSIENDTLMGEMQAELDKLNVPSLQLGNVYSFAKPPRKQQVHQSSTYGIIRGWMTAVLLVFFVVIVEIRLGIVNGTLHRKQVYIS